MLNKTKLALAVALVASTTSVAMAQGEFDANLANRYPAYDEPAAATGGLRSSAVGLQQSRATRGYDARRLPEAFHQQAQPDYPQSLPGGGGN
jgi:hypothetical protein